LSDGFERIPQRQSLAITDGGSVGGTKPCLIAAINSRLSKSEQGRFQCNPGIYNFRSGPYVIGNRVYPYRAIMSLGPRLGVEVANKPFPDGGYLRPEGSGLQVIEREITCSRDQFVGWYSISIFPTV